MEVTIRPLQRNDAFTSYKWRNDPNLWKLTGSKPDCIITPEIELAWIEKVMANIRDYRCAIVADGIYVGNIYLTNIQNKKADYHIFIGEKDYWNKGIAKRASKLIIEYGFEKLGLESICLYVRKNNK